MVGNDDELDDLVIRLAKSPSYQAMRELLENTPWLLTPDARSRLMTWLDSTTDPALVHHLESLVWLLDESRRRGVDDLFDELMALDGVITSLKAPRSAQPRSADKSKPLQLERVVPPSPRASKRLQRQSEQAFYLPALEQIEVDGGYRWLQALANAEGSESDPTTHFKTQFSNRERDVADALRGFSEVSLIDFTEIPVEWIKLGSPNAMTVWEPKDPGAAIGFDLVLINNLVLIAFAGLHAMRSGDPQIVVRTTRLLGDLLNGASPTDLEPWLLTLNDQVSDLRHSLDGMGGVAMRFVLGHELGHLALDHFQPGSGALMALEVLDGGEDLDDPEAEVSCFPLRALEYAADEWASRHLQDLARAAGTLTGAILSRTVPMIYFASADLLGSFVSPTTSPGKVSADTHPPDWERAQQLRPSDHAIKTIASAPQFAPLLELPDYLRAVTESLR